MVLEGPITQYCCYRRPWRHGPKLVLEGPITQYRCYRRPWRHRPKIPLCTVFIVVHAIRNFGGK
jgi:hypothetical protein